jgi:hypothetical protein
VLENAAAMVNRWSTCTRELYDDRREEEFTLDEAARVVL